MEDSVKRRAMIMHARLGCAECREKLQMARRSPTRADRSPSPVSAPCLLSTHGSLDADLARNAILERPRCRDKGLAAAILMSTPVRDSVPDQLRALPGGPSSRASIRGRRRMGCQQDAATHISEARLRRPAATSSSDCQQQRRAGAKPASKGPRQSNCWEWPEQPDATQELDEGIQEEPNAEPNPELSPDMSSRLPRWTEVFAMSCSRWEPEGPPETATPSKSPGAASSVPGDGPRLPSSSYRQTFTNDEACQDIFKRLPEFPSRSSAWKPAAEVTSQGAEAAGADEDEEANSEREEETRRAAETAIRAEEAAREAGRILALQKQCFQTKVDWALNVLDSTVESAAEDPSTLQRCFRCLMKKLHPDRVGHSEVLARAVELVREAKDVSQRHFSEVERPGPPRSFQAATLCAVPGQRRIRLQWLPPEDEKTAPVRKYVVRVVDPVCGRALTVAVLEPEYRSELQRFASVEELGSYILAEQELNKMPGLWKQSEATVQVVAANEAGESSWAVVLKLALTAKLALPLTVSATGLRQTSPSRSECRTGVIYAQPAVVRTVR